MASAPTPTTAVNASQRPSRDRSLAPVFVVGSPRSGTTLLYHMLLSAGRFAIYRAETHVFNGTTALILESLEQGPQSIEAVKDRVQEALGVAQNVLTANDFAFAVGRLEELGLVERFDEASSVQCLSVT